MVSRREFLVVGGAAAVGGALSTALPGCRAEGERRRWRIGDGRLWQRVRAEFELSPRLIHMAGLLLASHPRPVREAVERHRRALDRDPVGYLEEHGSRLEADVRRAAAAYLGAQPTEIALTDSTTEAIALAYHGIRLRPGHEILTTTHDYYSTHEALRYAAARAGTGTRRIALYDDPAAASTDEMTDRLIAGVGPNTRVVAVTWVHSSTGVKIPVDRMASALARVNADREPGDRALLCLDGVHGLGVEDAGLDDLGCDLFMAGTHKWIFAPRGTGILWGHPRVHDQVSPTIPTFTRGAGWGGRMTPGGFQSFEHVWAAAEAFDFHRELGRGNVAHRIHQLARQTREGLAAMRRVRLHTPLADDLAAGIVCFDVDGVSPEAVVHRLRERGIIASTTPYEPSFARLAPGLLNDAHEVDTTLAEIHGLR